MIEGDTARPDVWAKLDAVLARDWPHASGHTLPVRVMCVDAGYATQDVYAWVREHPQASWGPAGAAARQPRTAVAVIDATYTPAGGDPVGVRVIARRPDTIVGFGETRIHAETATFEVRVSKVANPRPGDQLTVSSETFVIQGEPERRDPDRLVWSLDLRAV